MGTGSSSAGTSGMNSEDHDRGKHKGREHHERGERGER
jgi:hypothetical protein